MSDDDVEIVDLIANSDSDDGSSKRRRKSKFRTFRDLAETDESSEEPDRHKRDVFRKSSEKSGKKSVKRRHHNALDSDDEFAKKPVHKKHKSPADSDYEPSAKHGPKKREGSRHSDEDFSKKSSRKKHKGSPAASVERTRKSAASKSASLDSDDETGLNSSTETKKTAVPRKRMKITPIRRRPSVADASESDDSTFVAEKTSWRRDLAEIKESAPKKRKKTTPVRERPSVAEASESDDSTFVPEKSGSSRRPKDNGSASDSETPESCATKKSPKNRSSKKEAAANKADDGVDTPDQPKDDGLDSDSKKAESPTNVSKEVAATRKSTSQNEADAERADDGMVEECKSSNSNDSDLDLDNKKAESCVEDVLKEVAPIQKCSSQNEVNADEATDSADIADERQHTDSNDKGLDSEPAKCSPEDTSKEVAPMPENLPQNEADTDGGTERADTADKRKRSNWIKGRHSGSTKAKHPLARFSKKVAPFRMLSLQDKLDMGVATDGTDTFDECNSSLESDTDLDSDAKKPIRSSAKAPLARRTNGPPRKKEANPVDGSDDDFMAVPERSSFEKGYRAKKVIGLADYGPDGVKFLIQFHGQKGAELVLQEKCRKYCPDLMLKFYEEHITWTKSE